MFNLICKSSNRRDRIIDKMSKPEYILKRENKITQQTICGSTDLIDMRYSWIEHNFLDPLSDVDREKMVFIASVGVGSHLGITVSDNETFDRMKQFYATKSINIDSARFPNMYSACQKYDTFRRIAGTLTLSPAGKLIGDMIYSQDFAKYSRFCRHKILSHWKTHRICTIAKKDEALFA